MKKTLLAFSILLIGIIFCSTFSIAGLNKLLKKDGAAPGYTGSPGDSLKNCTNCHGGVATPVEGWLFSNIPEEGYEPGKRYTITAINKEVGATRFGFEASPQADNGNLLGEMIVTDTVRTKFVGGNKYITYTANGVEGVDSLSWDFDWIAPSAGTGTVKFYAGFNSNYQGHKEDDKTYLSTLTLPEKGANGLNNKSTNNFFVHLFPNPVVDRLSVRLDLKENSKVELQLFDQMGKKLYYFNLANLPAGSFQKEIKVESLKNGNYFLTCLVNGRSASKAFTIIH